MENELKFDKNRRRVKYCPCGKSNKNSKFAPYKGFENKGYCHSCGETFLPKSGFDTIVNPKNLYKLSPVSYHDRKLVSESGRNFKKNNFIQQLKQDFPETVIKEAILKYLIGTSKRWNGATVFWQIDNNQNVRHGKIMLYDKETGKRVKKNGKAFIDSIRNRLKLKETHNLKQCLFGLHLINEFPNKKIALVESEKTAIKMSMFKPEYNWLATGSKSLLKYKYLKELRPFPIVLFPDKGAYDEWNKTAFELKQLGFNIKVSQWLENTDYPENSDLADLLIHENTKQTETNRKTAATENRETVTSKAEKTVRKMSNRNPLIYKLIDTFGLTDKNGCEISK